jgi:hypothetical protein
MAISLPVMFAAPSPEQCNSKLDVQMQGGLFLMHHNCRKLYIPVICVAVIVRFIAIAKISMIETQKTKCINGNKK